jgi:hypothetical protein
MHTESVITWNRSGIRHQEVTVAASLSSMPSLAL